MAEMTLLGGSPGVGAHRGNSGEGLLSASPFLRRKAATCVALVGRLHRRQPRLGGNVCNSVSMVFVVAGGAPAALHVISAFS